MTQIEDRNAGSFTARWRVSTLLHEAFLTAYIITRCQLVAEELVCSAIELLQPAEVSSSALVAETLRLAVEFTREKQTRYQPVSAGLALGNELAALMDLEPAMRISYVARILLGYPLADCVELLQTDAVTLTRNLLVAMRCLCERHQERLFLTQITASFSTLLSALAPEAVHVSN